MIEHRMLEHGGALRAAAARYNIPLENWLDISTGINPLAWPTPSIPAEVWRRLPEDNDGLERIAARYYGTDQLLAVAGTQAAIQALPVLRAPSRVGVLAPGYNEHAHAWRRGKHRVRLVEVEQIEAVLSELDVLVVSNPNNPTGVRFAVNRLCAWHADIAARGGWLVIDEAFVDATPEHSLAEHAGSPGLIILRSLGKFFGLAGARVGFILSETGLREQLRAQLGPWSVSGPSRWVAARALADSAWQHSMREQLPALAGRLVEMLNGAGYAVSGSTAYFCWLKHPQAAAIHTDLAKQGVLVRYFAEPQSLRFGLLHDEQDWRRLGRALSGNKATYPPF